MIHRILATVANGGRVAPGRLPTGDPDPTYRETCDRCGYEAMVLVERGPDVLTFCGHHYQVIWVKLYDQGWILAGDRRADLVRSD